MLMVMVANFVLVFVYSTQAARDLWWSKLMQESQEEVQKEPPTTNVQVSYQDLIASIEYVSVYCCNAYSSRILTDRPVLCAVTLICVHSEKFSDDVLLRVYNRF